MRSPVLPADAEEREREKESGPHIVIVAGSFKSQLIDYSKLPREYGDRVEGSIWQFIIIRPSFLKCDWLMFSIWNGLIVFNQSGQSMDDTSVGTIDIAYTVGIPRYWHDCIGVM